MFSDIQGNLMVIMMLLYLIGALLPFLYKGNVRLSLVTGCITGVIASLLGLGLGIEALFSMEAVKVSFGQVLPGVELTVQIDRLSGFFLTTICLVTFLVGFYSLGYMKIYRHENITWWNFCYNIFILSMILVVTVNNAIVFLVFWEVMTLASYFLVTFEYRSQQVRKAGFIYIAMTHLGTVFIIGAFLVMAKGFGGWGYETLASNSASLSTIDKSIVFLLALVGFGTKAGVVPLNVWLPLAHPAAPSNVSAVMSGVMIKMAIYGMIRVIIDILGPGPAWWGGLVLTIGIISAVIGVIYALMEHDLKRLLAFHSVENIGIILMGIGTSLVLYAWSMPVLAAIALAAGLFHVFNHAIFKSLLFLATGSIYYATHTRDIEKLGGLIKRMPQTALLFLIGAISISAIPPFNGFASEYQIYQSLLNISYLNVSGFWSIAGILACVALALTGALAAACFVKAFGISFLALPRTKKSARAREVPLSMRLSMAPLAAFCLVLGIFPQVAMNALTGVASQLVPGSQVPEITTYNFTLALVLIVTVLMLLGLSRLFGVQRVRKSETWGCGIETDATMEYSAASYSQPIRRVYRGLLQPRRKIKIRGKALPYFGYNIYFEEHVKSMIRECLYSPLRRLTITTSKKWRCIQSGNINLYLSYVFLTLVVLLVWVR
ncbi:hydrogenase 4 subunit B [Desulfotomaculum sp. 1211_IL3151]|uniref:hydrogenase 4 subunit B n=1 Tax=Desulfotomaculum sp. 1211_IL3151 TaxID=3084055 RepID=UPI002FD8D23F